MEGIRLIGISICVTTATTAIFSMLVPNQKLNKVLQFAISLFFLTGIISPFFSQKLDFHIPIETDIFESSTDMSQAVSNSVLTIAQIRLEETLSKQLLEHEITAKKIKVSLKNTNNNSDNNISISHVKVYIDKKDMAKADEIKKLLHQLTGADILVFDY